MLPPYYGWSRSEGWLGSLGMVRLEELELLRHKGRSGRRLGISDEVLH